MTASPLSNNSCDGDPMTPADMTTDDLEYAVAQGIYGDDRMTSRQLDAACAALTELVRRLEAAERRAADVNAERAAVVAYLRQSASVADEFGAVADALTAEADAIERGEHVGGAP